MQTFYQVNPRYTAGSPAQVDEAQARRVAQAEVDALRGSILDGTEPDRGDAGLDGIAEQVTDFEHRRVVVDLITDRRREFPIRSGRIVEAVSNEPRIQAVPMTAADALKADLRTLQALANRRGGDWLIKWAAMFEGVQPSGRDLDVKAAEATGDPVFLDYVKNFPFGPDPRD